MILRILKVLKTRRKVTPSSDECCNYVVKCRRCLCMVDGIFAKFALASLAIHVSSAMPALPVRVVHVASAMLALVKFTLLLRYLLSKPRNLRCFCDALL